MEMMKAVRIHDYGGPEVLKLEDIPRPQIAPDEVLIRVHAAGVNPVDWKIREGYRNVPLPLTPGWDVAGTIEQMGAEVTDFTPGDAVYSYFNLDRPGAYAEYVAVPAAHVALKPKSVDFAQAAAIPLAALTAWQGLFDHGGLTKGQKVLIHAAAGGVGSFAVQLAKYKDAHVVGTASRQNLQFLHDLGVDEAIDYTRTPFEDVVDAADVVLDTIGGETQARSWQVLKKGGILVSIVQPPSQQDAEALGVRAASFVVQPNGHQLAEIGGLVDAGKVKPVVQAVMPLTKVQDAQVLSQAGHARGKIVLQVA